MGNQGIDSVPVYNRATPIANAFGERKWKMNINNFIMGISTTSIGYIYFTHFFTMNCLCVTESSANKWYGRNLPQEQFGEYVSHWMPIPSAPIE
jgi:hypothetical protein